MKLLCQMNCVTFIHGKYPLSERIKLLLKFDIVGNISVSLVHVDDLPLPLF